MLTHRLTFARNEAHVFEFLVPSPEMTGRNRAGKFLQRVERLLRAAFFDEAHYAEKQTRSNS